MKRAFPFYPILLATFPVVALYSLNLAMVPLGDLWRPLEVAAGGASILWALLSLALRNFKKGSLLTAVVLAMFCSYGPLAHFGAALALQIVEALILVAASIGIIRTRKDLDFITRTLNFGTCVLIVLPLVQIFTKRSAAPPESFLHVSLPVHPIATVKPDIFFIIVDGYGRADQLKRVMGYSNEPFIADLRNRGFYVADQSHSNYVQTQLSVTATLNLSYLQDFPKAFPRNSDEREALEFGMDKSFISAYLKQLDYKYIGVTSGFNEVKFPSADESFNRPLALTMIESALLQLTPITVVDSPVTSLFGDRREALVGALENLQYLTTPTAKPRFVVAHILAPHPPFVFDAAGNPIHQALPFGFWDGSHYMGVGGTKDMYRTGYVGQVQYLNDRLLPIIDSIVSKAHTKPVIIIEGDHGSKLGLDQEDWGHTDMRESFGNLMAFYVPDSVRPLLYPKITSFNTFRVLLNGLFNEKLPLLPDRSFYSAFSSPYQFIEVTKQVAD